MWWRRVAADAIVGAWEMLGRAGTVGPRSRYARRFQRVGDRSAFVFPQGRAMGERWIRVGADTLVCADVVLSAGMWPDEPFVPPRGWAISIGDRCSVGRGTAIVGRVGIDVGDDVTFGPGVYVTDHNHEFAEPDVPIKDQWLVESPVAIGDGCWLGTGAIVLPGSVLGRNVAVAAGSVVRGDVPDRCVVAGAPARIVRRWDPALGRWDPPLPPDRGAAAPDAPPGWYDAAALRRRSPAQP